MQERISHAEYVEWQAFAAIEPLPTLRGDYQTAMLMTLLANIHRGKHSKKPKLTDFLPDWWQDKRSPAALAAKFRALTARGEPDGDTLRDTPSKTRSRRD